MVYLSYTRISDLGKRDSSLTSNTNDAQTPYAYDEIAHVRVPPGYADHPEDERILLFPHTLTNDSSFGDLLLIRICPCLLLRVTKVPSYYITLTFARMNEGNNTMETSCREVAALHDCDAVRRC